MAELGYVHPNEASNPNAKIDVQLELMTCPLCAHFPRYSVTDGVHRTTLVIFCQPCQLRLRRELGSMPTDDPGFAQHVQNTADLTWNNRAAGTGLKFAR